MALAGITKLTRIFQVYQLSKYSINFLTKTDIKNEQFSTPINILHSKYFCTQKNPPGSSEAAKASAAKKRKGLKSPEITLIMPEEDIVSMTLDQAEKLAKRRNLKLVNIVDFDTKSERPVYKLMTKLQYFEQDLKAKEQKRKEKNSAVKENKLFTLSTKISEHDLYVKIKQMSKLLTKNHKVQVYISQDGNPSKAEEIASTIEEELKDVSIKHNQVKKQTTLKLFFHPKLDDSENENKVENEKTENKKTKISVTK